MIRELIMTIIIVLGSAYGTWFAIRAHRVARTRAGWPRRRGELDAKAPVIALDGALAIAVHRRVAAVFLDGDDSSAESLDTTMVAAGITIEGSPIALVDPIVIGVARSHRMSAADLAHAHPELHARIAAVNPKMTFDRATIEETTMPLGIGTVGGERLVTRLDDGALARDLAAPARTLGAMAATGWLLAAIIFAAPFIADAMIRG